MTPSTERRIRQLIAQTLRYCDTAKIGQWTAALRAFPTRKIITGRMQHHDQCCALGVALPPNTSPSRQTGFTVLAQLGYTGVISGVHATNLVWAVAQLNDWPGQPYYRNFPKIADLIDELATTPA